MQNTSLHKAQAGIKIARRNTKNDRYEHDTTFIAESEEELKSLLMKVKEDSEKFGLKLSIKKQRSWHPAHHFMTNSWGKSGNWQIFFSWALKSLQMVTAAMKLKDACSVEEKL